MRLMPENLNRPADPGPDPLQRAKLSFQACRVLLEKMPAGHAARDFIAGIKSAIFGISFSATPLALADPCPSRSEQFCHRHGRGRGEALWGGGGSPISRFISEKVKLVKFCNNVLHASHHLPAWGSPCPSSWAR